MTGRFTGIDGLTAAPGVAVVIDVMRAFTTAAWAFAGGAQKIVLAGSLDEALALKALHPDWLTLKDGRPAPGFDAVNSPAVVRSLALSERTLVQTTTYGTVGALAARGAGLLLCASFPVAAATARAVTAYGDGDVAYVITGDDGRAEEDRACARYIAGLVAGRAGGAGAYLRSAAGSRSARRLADGVRRGHPGIHADDAALCLEADRFPFAMRAAVEDDGLTLRTTAPPA